MVSAPFSVGEDGCEDGRMAASSDSHDSLDKRSEKLSGPRSMNLKMTKRKSLEVGVKNKNKKGDRGKTLPVKKKQSRRVVQIPNRWSNNSKTLKLNNTNRTRDTANDSQ